MKRLSSAWVLFCVAGLAGCSAYGHFYPVKGPLAAQTPPPVLVGKFTAHPPTKLTVAMTLNDGERATGTIYVVLPVPKKPVPANVPPAMTAQWDAVYGRGSYVARVLGQGQDGRGTIVGDRGTALNVEVSYNPRVSPLQGVAEDNAGNVYKVTF